MFRELEQSYGGPGPGEVQGRVWYES